MDILWISDNLSETPCCLCNGDVYEFSIPSDIWNTVIRKSGVETDKEYLCVNCFMDALRIKLGINKIHD